MSATILINTPWCPQPASMSCAAPEPGVLESSPGPTGPVDCYTPASEQDLRGPNDPNYAAVLEAYVRQIRARNGKPAVKDLTEFHTPNKESTVRNARSYKPDAALGLANQAVGTRADELGVKFPGKFKNPKPQLDKDGKLGKPAYHPSPKTDAEKADPNYYNHKNCAMFVSSVLYEGKGISKKHSGVEQLELQLHEDGWRQLPEGQEPKKGDVWICTERTHVEMVNSVKNGKVELIGARGPRDTGTADNGVGQTVVTADPPGKGFYMTPGEK